jgi:ABC-2 type transport system ATP-binding protein/lipopolysaccharide transport system ATP-binding protein
MILFFMYRGKIMEEAMISVDHVSMRFNLAREKVDSLKEYIIKAFKGKMQYDEFWALKDVSFDIMPGDSVGLIGLNGSGKSTMLKVIARVLKPTKGSVTVRGSVAPLIELGAGFDFDLTGKENIFLNGALLGRSRKEMNAVLEDIIEFSELRDFMDVPMKNYSSGMLSRLAFAIATSGKADILIVDEVLAVGDFRFQQKCIDRIQGMMNEGTTVLFVSHSIEQVEAICNKVAWIKSGELHMFGDAKEICEIYKQS